MRHDIGLREERIIRSKNEADSFARISSILTVLFIMMMINLQITLVASEPVPINYSLNSSNNDVFSAYNIIPNMSNITYENIRITPELNFTVQEIFSNQNLSSNAIRHLSIGFTDASQYALDLSNDYELWISYGLSKQIVISKYKYFGTLKFPINYDASNPGYYQFQLIGKNDNTIVASTFYYDDGTLNNSGAADDSNAIVGNNHENNYSSNESGHGILNNSNLTQGAGSLCGNFTLSLDKQVYDMGEKVSISLSIISKPESSPELFIMNSGITYKFVGELSSTYFIPYSSGTYTVVLMCQNIALKSLNFTVLEGLSDRILSNNANNQMMNASQNMSLTQSSYQRNYSYRNISIRNSHGKIIINTAKIYADRKTNISTELTPSLVHADNNSNGSINGIITSKQAVEYADMEISGIDGMENSVISIDGLEIKDANTSISVEKVPESSVSIKSNKILTSYALDLSNLNFTNGSISQVAKGTGLWKCAAWNFSEQKCLGPWQKIRDISPGQQYTIELSTDDPGYAETVLNILNIQSYPIVGGNWTVSFNTTGKADLKITAYNDTTWSAVNENNELRFLEIRCGAIAMPYEWINDSVFIANYSCNQTSYEISKVLIKGKHTLEFSFGNDTKFAYNNAADRWWNVSWFYRMAINITEMNNTNLTGFQVNLSVNTASIIAAGKMNGDCSDIRFVDNASNVLPFYLDTGCNTTSTKVWVRLNLSANSSSIIYIYYGNPSASSSANGTATFEFFDDFNSASVDTSKWFVGGGMTQSGGVVSGVNSGPDYLFGKTRIFINTTTLIRMRSHSTGGVARPGVLNKTGNPFNTMGFGWQDWTDNLRYTDTFDTVGTQNSNYNYNIGWYNLETTWTAASVVFMTNGAVTITHTTNIPLYSRSLYAQVDGNADYDLFYTRKYIPAAPKVNNGAEEFINISPSITDAQCFKTGTGYVNCTSFQYGDILEKVRANCTSSIGGTISLAEFTFRNINDNTIYFDDVVTMPTDGYWEDDNTNVQIFDSGNFNVNVKCWDNYNYLNQTDINWSIPFGTLSAQLISPNVSVNVSQYKYFNFTSRIYCNGGECGDINATLDPINWWNISWRYKKQINLSVALGATPKNYQIPITIDSSNVGINFNWSNECINSNSSRVRFINSSETGELDFWVDSCSVAGRNMTVWVKVDNNITTANYSIYLYYGNSQAIAKSNGTATFDFFEDGTSLTGWSVGTGSGITSSAPASSPSGSTNAFYSNSGGNYYLLNKTANTQNPASIIIQYYASSTFLGNFLFTSSAAGVGTIVRHETRSGNYAGLAKMSSWTSWYCPSTSTTLAANTWYTWTIIVNGSQVGDYYKTGEKFNNNFGTAINPLSSTYTDGCGGGTETYTNNGAYIGLIGDGGGASYTTYWQQIIIRKYANVSLITNFANEQWAGTKDIVPMNNGNPFYTISSNPMYLNSTSCLGNLQSGSYCDATWIINATGLSGYTWEFYTIYSSLNYSSNISTVQSPRVNITISGNYPPVVTSVSIVPSSPNYMNDMNCTFTVADANYFDSLTANVSWFRNSTLNYSSVISVANGVPTQSTLDHGNITANDSWYCGVKPYDGTVYGNQVNSTNVTILPLIAPIINQIQCRKGTVWGSCSNILYGSNLTAVRANCTAPSGNVVNVTFNLTNIEDSKSLFYGLTTNNSLGYLEFDNNATIISDSGTFNLSVVCNDNNGLNASSNTLWSIPWGNITVSLVDPLSNRNAAQNRFFNFTTSITCTGGECGYFNATLDPLWWDANWKYKMQLNLSVLSGATPQYYQVKITLNSSQVGADWNWTNECINSTDARIRFLNSSENGELPYWIENCSASSKNISLWLKVDQALNTSNYSVYLYYGNPSGTSKSNGTATFDYFDTGDQLSSWNVAGASGVTTLQGLPVPSYYSNSSNTNYLYKNIGLTINSTVDFNVMSNGLGDFFFLTDPSGFGQQFRSEARNGQNSGIAAAASWTSWSAPTACANIATNTWYTFTLNIYSTTAQAYINGTACGTPYTISNLGGYIGLVGDALGATYTTWWDNLKVRKNANVTTVVNYGPEQITWLKGIIPMNSGNPFYTTTANPMYYADNSCLANMGSGTTCYTSWLVNATGPINSTWQFYVIYSPMNYSSYISQKNTSIVNITITNSVPPTISNVQCLLHGGSWINCTSILYNNTIDAVRAMCGSNMQGTINNVSFTLKNINDNKAYFNVATTNQSSGYWIYNNTNLTILDSGDFNLNVICSESSIQTQQDINWSIAWGVLTAQLISPSSSINVTQNKFFNFSAKVTCSGGECGYLNATLDPVGWWDSNWIYRMAINITEMNNTNLTGFQVNLSVNTSGPIAAGRMNGDCSDIRFVDNASNVLPFYLDTGCNTTSTKVWVRLNLSANSSSIIYIYYGNPSASSSANGTATFEFFDDFNSASVDTSKWFVGGGMTQSGGVVSGVNSGTDYLFGKTRININTLTYIRMRDKSTSSSARPGVLNNTGNPFSVIGFGWQDYQDGYRYTDTYDSAVNQVQHNLFNTSWFALETIWTANNVTFIVNGSVLGVHTAQVPVSTRILYGQVDGNAEYDLFYTRKYITIAPTYVSSTEEIKRKGDIPMNSGTPFYTTTQNPANSSTFSCLANMGSGSSCNVTWSVNATGLAGSTWEFFVTFASLNYSANVSAINSTKINITILNNLAPSVPNITIIPSNPNYLTDMNCSFTVTDANYFDPLTANVRWYKNGALAYSENVSVSNGVQAQRILNHTNVTIGDIWYCAVIPYDGIAFGAQTNSSNVTILSSPPPTINLIQCQENGVTWESCSNILYGDNLTAVRVNCTANGPGGYVTSANFTLSNIEDSKTLFTGNTTNTSLGYLVYDNNDSIISDSGTFNLAVTCFDNNNTFNTGYTAWSVPWGVLTAQLISPNTSINVTQNRFFNFSAQVTCTGGECGYLNATLDPVSWWNLSWFYRKSVNITEMTGSTLNNFQVNLSINTSGLIAAGKLNANCSDLRFTDNASNVLPFYLDSGCNSSNTIVWIKTNLSAGSINVVYMYYGNPSAVSVSNGTSTFDFFDDFNSASVDTSKWSVNGAMVQSGGVASGSTSLTDYFFGKIRININTTTLIRMRSHSTSGVARPGVLNTSGNPYSTIGFGWQDWTDNLRYTDTFDTGINQNSNYNYNTGWYTLETIWTDSSVVFITNGTVTITQSTQVPVSTRGLYAQVDGNADYDLIYTHKYATTAPMPAINKEEIRAKGDIPMNSGTPFYTITQNPANSSTFSCLANMGSGNSCNITWSVNATGPVGTTWEFFAIFASLNYSNNVSSKITSKVNLTIINNVAPYAASVALTPQYPILLDDLNCSFTVFDSSPLDMLSANVTWYKNNATYSSVNIGVMSGVPNVAWLGSGNLSLGDYWQCGVTPRDPDSVGPQVNSSIVHILNNKPPVINQIQCLKNNSIWTNCSNLSFSDTFSGVRINCTSVSGGITNVSFNLTNTQHANTYFSNTTSNNISDWWIFYNNLTINNSGDYMLYALCVNNNSDFDSEYANWTVPWGKLIVNLSNPTGNANVQKNNFFNFTVNITCVGGECGNINATLDPIAWWNTSWKYRIPINISELNNTALNNYQINVTINTLSIISAGKMKSDCSDVRMVDNSSNELNYFIESGCNTNATIIWIKANITANTNTTIYMYYNNPSAVAKSNGTGTFDLYDDFAGASLDTTIWNDTNSGQGILTFASSKISIASNGDWWGASDTSRYIVSIANFSYNYIAEAFVVSIGSDAYSRYFGLRNSSATNGKMFVMLSDGDSSHVTNVYRDSSGTIYYGDHTGLAIADKTNKIARFDRIGNTVNSYYNGSLMNSRTDVGWGLSYVALTDTVSNVSAATFDWVRVRKYIAKEPTYVLGIEEPAKGVISTVAGTTPFYTTTSNPMDYTTTSCLYAMTSGSFCQITWNVNATGNTNTTWEFFVFFNSTTYPGYVNSVQTKHINITISDSSLIPPVVTLVYPPPVYYSNNSNILFNCSATDNTGLKNMTLYLRYKLGLFLANSTNNISGTSNSTIFNKALQEGTYTWNCLGYDIDGNSAWATSNRTLTVDLNPPGIALSAPNGTNFTTPVVNFNFTVSDTVDNLPSCNLTIDNVVNNFNFSVNSSIMTTITVNNATIGVHYWNVTCWDDTGNINTSVTWMFNVLGFGPNVTLVTQDNLYQQSSTISLQYNATDTMNLTLAVLYINDLLNSSNATVDNGLIDSFSLNGLAEGRYNWTVNVTDGSGFTAQPKVRWFTIDYTKPSINLSAPADNASTNLSFAYFNFTAADNSINNLSCNLTMNNVVKLSNFTAANGNMTSKLVVNISNGVNYWNVTCWDSAGNVNTSTTWHLNVSSPPNVMLNFPYDNYSQNKYNLTMSYIPADVGGFNRCDLIINGVYNQSNLTAINNSGMNYFNITFSSTGKYNWTVNCTDTTGISTIAPARTLYIDNSSPAINLYNPQPGDSIYNSTVNFNYSASDDFDNLLSCNLTMDGVVNRTNISTPAGYVINISINLSTQSIHYWNVSCWDDAGNINTSETRNFSNFVPSAITLYAPGINATLNYGQNIRFDYMPNDANGINFTQLILNGKVNATSYNVTVGFMNYFYANLTDGFYSWTVNATNNVGLVGTANSRNFTVDTTPPNVIYTYPNNTAVVGWNNVTFNFTATDNIASVMACNVTLNNSILYSNISITNGTPFVFTQILGDGNYNWSVSCKDATNWTNIPTVVNFSVSAPPNVTLNWPINYYRNNTVNIVFNYTPYDAIGFQNCTLYYDGAKNITQGIIVKNQPNYFTLNNLNGGVHNWTVQCIDLAPDLNVYAPPVAYFIIDLTGPNITLLSPQPNQTFNLNNVTFNWTPIDYNGTAINCTIAVTDNPANRTANISALSATVFSQQFNNLSEGIHYWNVSCMDDLGNMNYSGIWNFTINQADLSINTSDIIFNNTNPDENQSLRINATVHNIGGVTANNVLVEFWDGNPGLGGIFIGNDTGTIGINGSRSFSTQWNISLGYHTIYVLSDPHNAINDLNRNNNNATINISVLRSIINAPSNSTGLASANVSINFTLQDFTNGALNYSVFVDNLSNGQNGTAVDNNSYAINVTFAQGMHSIKIEGLDYLGRRKNSTAVFLLIDYTPPNSTINTQNNTWYNYSHPQINITSYDNIAAMINYTIFANGSANIFGNITNGTSLLVNLSFASDGAYAIMMQSFDELNNTANSSVKIIYVDTHPPGIQLYSPVNGANFTSRAVSLNYSFYDNLASYGMCNLTLDGINVASYNSTLNYIMNYTANNLIEGSHYWNVSCIDIAGNINVSQTRSFNIYIFPNISLVNPPNNYWSNTENNTFYFNVSDETGLQNCSVIINGQVSKTKNNSQLTNNATNNITVNNTLSGNYSWFIECYDNTSYRTYSNTSSRTLYVDTISPQPMIETINNTWYNMTSPSITFNITDNMDDMLNYTIYVDGSINRTGTVSNSTSTSINLTGILDGVHSIVLEAVDEALNKKNSSPIIIYIDTIKPSINLTYPPNGTNITTNYINLNFTPYDNLAPYLICNLTLDGNIIGSNLNVSNGSNANISVTNLIGGNHYWNVSCIDIVGNKNTSANSIFYVMMPDLYIDNASIWFSNYNLIENQTITVFANVTNIGNVNASNFTVEIRLNALNGTLLYNASMNISANGSKQISLNYTVPLGLSDFYVLLDTPLATNGTVKEENESNNWAHRAVYVAFWQYLLGTTNDKLVINDNVNSTLFDWVVSNSTGSNLYATDVDSVISWTKLQALGRSAANASSFNDFAALDIKLNSTSYSDSVNKTFTTTGNPIELANYTIFNRLIKNISIVNSTNNSNFKTGILWDTSQGGASYNGNQDVVFVSQIHKNMQGYNGTVDYEMRVPASLRSYRAGYDMIALYIEIN